MAIDTWQVDPVHSCIHFSVTHCMVSKIHGRFTKWSGAIQLDEASPASSSVEIQIDAASIDTNEPNRDGHLKGADLFNVAQYPEITGDFALRGVTKPVVLEVEHGGNVKDPWGNSRGGFSVKGSIDRKEFGLTFNMPLEGGGFVLGDKVDFSIDMEAVKAAAQAA